ncbi:hypothetical protein Trydic_g12625 [Trypoxylus dichotomus]
MNCFQQISQLITTCYNCFTGRNCAVHTKIPIVEALLSHPDIEYDAKNNTNETALFLSRIWKRTFTFCDISPDIEDEAVIAALLNRGCDINLTNGASHETVLHRTVMENDRSRRNIYPKRC